MNEIREDMLKVKRMMSEVEIILGKREGETELVNQLIDAQNLLTYCMSRLENAVVPPCKVGDTVYIPWHWNGQQGVAFAKVEEINVYDNKNHIMLLIDLQSDNEEYEQKYGGWKLDKCIGETIFLTREEAETALAERQGKK